jgi:AAA family ATP:ADP antiporter
LTASEARPRRGLPAALSRLVAAEPEEVPAVLAGFLLFFLLFTGYFMLRPVRETMGVAGGVDNLQWLFTGTFVVTLLVTPIYGWVARAVPRERLLPVCYLFFAASFVAFALGIWRAADDVWLGRGFYVWLSMFTLFVVSIGWSFMADVMRPGQAKRLFGQVAAGASLGGLAGPLVSGLLVAHVGHAGLLLISAALLIGCLVPVRLLLQWRARQPRAEGEARAASRPIGGGVLAGLTLIARSPYLIGVSVFVLLLTSVTTFLYFEQARLVEATFPDETRQTQVFAAIDVAVQSLTIFIQIFLTGHLTRRLGVTVLLTLVPVLMVAGFGLLAAAAAFPVLAGVMILRRVGEYALVRPGREMLFTSVDNETKYKAKNAIDTVVYRGGDVLSAWLNTAVAAVGSGAAVALLGAAIAAAWAALGFRLGRIHDRRAQPEGT